MHLRDEGIGAGRELGIAQVGHGRDVSVVGVPFAVRTDGSRPLQLFARWYGISLTYPHCDIYGTD